MYPRYYDVHNGEECIGKVLRNMRTQTLLKTARRGKIEEIRIRKKKREIKILRPRKNTLDGCDNIKT